MNTGAVGKGGDDARALDRLHNLTSRLSGLGVEARGDVLIGGER